MTIKIIVRTSSDEAQTVAGVSGESLMKALVAAGVNGIDAECGGACSCATCHVVLGDAWWGLITPAGELEREMLEFSTSELRPGSRLSCQVSLSEQLDGVELTIPEA